MAYFIDNCMLIVFCFRLTLWNGSSKHSNPSLPEVVAIETAQLKHLAVDDVISVTTDNTFNFFLILKNNTISCTYMYIYLFVLSFLFIILAFTTISTCEPLYCFQ